MRNKAHYIWKLTGYEAEKLSVLRNFNFFRREFFLELQILLISGAGLEKSLAPIKQ